MRSEKTKAKHINSIKMSNEEKLARAIEHAINRGGLCLSTSYQGSKHKVKWKCKDENHEPWEATFCNVLNHYSWCPECGKTNLTEKQIKVFVECFYGAKFKTQKPKWNNNKIDDTPYTTYLHPMEILLRKKKTKPLRNLEIDMYNEDMGVGFEYDGEYHYKPIKKISSNEVRIKKMATCIRNDRLKEVNCLNNNVKLYRIPYCTNGRVNFFPLLRHFIKHCKAQGLQITYTLKQIKYMKSIFDNI
jgi:hypothetical protein